MSEPLTPKRGYVDRGSAGQATRVVPATPIFDSLALLRVETPTQPIVHPMPVAALRTLLARDGICQLDSRMIYPAVLATSYGVAEVCCGEATIGAQDPNPRLLHVKKRARLRVLAIVDP